MNDFFGEPIFKPTGTDWIDHAFTAAVLDDIEWKERGRRASEFNAFIDKLNAPISAESEATVEYGECIIYGEKYDLSSVLPFSLKHDHSTAMGMIEQIAGVSHADAMKLELRICQRGFIPLEYPDPF